MSPQTGRWSAGVDRFLIPLLDLVFPQTCVGCGRVGQVLCAACTASLYPQPPVLVEAGSAIAPLLALCALGDFTGTLQTAIHAFKFSSVSSLGPPLGQLMAVLIEQAQWPSGMIVPVPLHDTRLRQRGFNQSALLATEMANSLGWPLADGLLIRQRQTRSQVGLDYQQRQQNVEDAFAIPDPAIIQNQHIILVDDVYTTGATMRACAATLVQSGSAAVRGVAAARAGYRPPPV